MKFNPGMGGNMNKMLKEAKRFRKESYKCRQNLSKERLKPVQAEAR